MSYVMVDWLRYHTGIEILAVSLDITLDINTIPD